jgi:serine phosphatase RsbU (regulator of sigma subunit)/ligand-binding sensor domain-containing protein/ABC-type amino acid transport substrate-binding protein
MKVRLLPILFLIVFILQPPSVFARDLTTIKKSGKIYVGFTKDDLGTINYDLAVEFAKYLNVEMVPVDITWDEAFMKNGSIPSDLETNPSVIYNPDIFSKVDIICSTFTVLEWRRKIFDFAETLNSAELILTDKKSGTVKELSDLAGKTVAFMKGTSFETHLNSINRTLNGAITLVPRKTNEEVKELLKEGKVFGIVLDADEALNLNVSSKLKYTIAIPVTPMSKTAWAVEKGNNLQKEVENFFRTIQSNEELDKLFSQRFGIKYSDYEGLINKIILLEKHNHDLDRIIDEGKLVVGLREKELIWSKNGKKEFMAALAREFADYLGISLEVLVTPYPEKYWETETGRTVRDSSYSPDWFGYIDLAGDIFAPAAWQKGKVSFIPVLPSEFTVVARKDIAIKNIGDLKGKKGVIAGNSAYEELMTGNGLKNYFTDSDTNLLADIKSGKADYTVLNDARFILSEDNDIESKFSLGKTDLCWAVRNDQPQLKARFREFVEKSTKNGLIRYLLDDPARSAESAITNYYDRYQAGQFPSVLYGTSSGLPQEDIYSVFQDRQGYMWFGTCSGAVRYNGREMKSMGTSVELSENTVRAIAQDSAGHIYLASSNGITVIDRDTVAGRLFEGNGFNSIFIDSRDNKWFIGSKGISLLSASGDEINLNSEHPELPAAVRNIDEDISTGDLYISTPEGIFCYTAEGKLEKRSDADCYFLFIDVHRHLWISSKEGLLTGKLADLTAGHFMKSARNLNSELKLDNDIIKEIRTDKSGSVWLIFDTKIIRMTSNDRWATIYDHNTGLKDNKILSALFDREDNLWIGYFGGLQRLSFVRGLRNFFPTQISSYIYSVSQADDGKIWIVSNNGVFYFDGKLVNFSAELDKRHNELLGHNEKYVMSSSPGGKLLFACGEGIYEVDPVTLRVLRQRTFDRVLPDIENIFVSSKGEIVLLTGIGGTLYYLGNFASRIVTLNNSLSANISRFIEKDGKILGGSATGIVELRNGELFKTGEAGCKVWTLFSSDSVLWAGTDMGLRKITNGNFSNIEPVSLEENTVVKSISPAVNRSYLWLGTNRGFAYFNKETKKAEFFIDSKDGLSGDEITPGGLFTDRNGLLWAGTYHGVSNFNLKAMGSVLYPPVCFIEKVLLNGREIEPVQGESFRYNRNNFVFEIAAISFTDEKSIEFEFYIRGTGNNYSSYNKGKEYKAYYNNLPPGKYEFIYKARGKNNVESYSQKYVFTIRPAWFNTWFFRIAIILFTVVLIYLLYRARVKTIEAQKKKLEEQVAERTRELQIANMEIQEQRDMARGQRDRIAEQKKEITDSIYYAERIQRSLLPPVFTLESLLPEHFVLFKPRNIVSGDFYWSFEKGDKVYVAAVDCTGHGVPGALMSMLGISFLNEIVIKSGDIEPAEILNQLRDAIIKALKQVGKEGESHDGMDLSMLAFNRNRTRITFAGANNPLYFVRNGVLEEIKGDKMPIGIYEKMVPFTNHTLDLRAGDAYYLFSDGYADQFGGPKAKKFMYSNLKKLFLDSGQKPMQEQGKILDETIVKWQGHLEQVDDIVVIGIRF